MRILRFLAVGALNTGTTFVIIYALMWAGSAPMAANAIGYGAGVILSFVLNRAWTFAHRGRWQGSLPRWLLVSLTAYLANAAAVWAALHPLGVTNAYLAQLAGILPSTAVGYLGAKYFTFRAEPASSR